MKIRIKSNYKKGKYIYGTLLKNRGTKIVAVFLSGLSGSKELPLFKNASREFLRNNIDVIRFNFCKDNDDKHRKTDVLEPEDLSFFVYMTELKNIIDSFSKKYSKIILIGHSFGAVISILFLDKYKIYKNRTELVLWDPSLLPWKKKYMDKDFQFNPKKKVYYVKNNEMVMNETFYKECIGIKNTANILQTLNKRVCIIAAEHGTSKNAKRYFSKIKDKKNSKLFIIKKTGHRFEGKKAQKSLFSETIKFLENKL